MYIGACALGLCIECVYWGCVLGLCIGALYWGCVLGLCIGALCIWAVHWGCVFIGVVNKCAVASTGYSVLRLYLTFVDLLLFSSFSDIIPGASRVKTCDKSYKNIKKSSPGVKHIRIKTWLNYELTSLVDCLSSTVHLSVLGLTRHC